jgi:CspA family cold shock protein
LKGNTYGYGHCKILQHRQGLWFYSAERRLKGRVCPYLSVERAGMSALREGQKLTYDVVNERGKDAASNLQDQ